MSGRKKVESVSFNDWINANLRRMLSTGTSEKITNIMKKK